MRFSHRDVTWPYESDSILAIQPTPDAHWGVLTRLGVYGIVDDSGVVLFSRRLSLDGLDLDKPIVLKLSRDLRFAAIAEEFGTRGQVTDLQCGETLMPLTRRDYHVKHCSFPLAFFEHGHRTLLVHATDWNRLDISDPLTGDCLTGRPSPMYVHGSPLPEHSLDYFHCGLSVSADQKTIFDNGWVWHPLGVPRTWSLEAWMGGNVWESEDGGSLRKLHTGGHTWDVPMAWVDDRRVMVWGLGEEFEEEQPLRAGVRVFDVTGGEEIATIEGVDVEPADEGWIAFDTRLYAVSPRNGTAVWDVDRRKCVHHDPEFKPRRYQPATRTFFSLEGDRARLSRFEY